MSAVDPVSDFLAREQEALGDLGQEINLDDNTKGGLTIGENNVSDLNDFGEDSNTNGGFVLLNGNSAANNSDKEEPILFNAFEQESGPLYNHQNSTSNGFSSDKVPGFESEATAKWREEFMERIRKKDAEEEIKKAELERNGKEELEVWYKRYREQLQARSKDLRESHSDSNFNKLGNGSKPTVNDAAVWENICEMCDFQAKPKVAPDMSRMRGILLSLKPNS